jgi:hypothetical protein
MRPLLLLALALGAAPAAAATLPPGTWTNAEDQYFRAEKKEALPFVAFRVEAGPEGPRWQQVDAFGAPLSAWAAGEPPATLRPDGEADAQAGNTTTRLRLARPFRCWVSVKREGARPDGGEDWSFHRDLALHDQGGRAAVAAEGERAPGVVIRMRNVVWPAPSPNRPSLVLYVHRPDEPDRALSYSWADPGARLVGINLRWMQASCTLAA